MQLCLILFIKLAIVSSHVMLQENINDLEDHLDSFLTLTTPQIIIGHPSLKDKSNLFQTFNLLQ